MSQPLECVPFQRYSPLHSQTKTPISCLSGRLLGEMIFPLLLEVEKPRSIDSLSRVCKEWRQILKSDIPWAARIRYPNFFQQYPRMAFNQVQAQSARELYLTYFPKTLKERIEYAYEKEQIYTSDFKAKVLPAILLGNPTIQTLIVKSFQVHPLILFATIPASLLPSSFDFRNLRWNQMSGYGLILGAGILSFSAHATALINAYFDWFGKPYPGTHPLEHPGVFPLVYLGASLLKTFTYRLTEFEGDSLLSKTFRVAKGTLAASIVLAKTTGHRLMNAARSFLQKSLTDWIPAP